LAHQLSYRHAATRVIQHRLSLGLQPYRYRGSTILSLLAGSWAHAELSQPGGDLSDKERASVFHSRYVDFRNYLAYTLYAPLYVEGSILTFKYFMWQVRPITPAFSSVTDVAVLSKDIPTGDCAIRSPVSDYTVQNDAHARMHVVAIKGVHAWSPRPAFHDRFLESHLRRLRSVPDHVTSNRR
jgi:hypothetical protein